MGRYSATHDVEHSGTIFAQSSMLEQRTVLVHDDWNRMLCEIRSSRLPVRRRLPRRQRSRRQGDFGWCWRGL